MLSGEILATNAPEPKPNEPAIFRVLLAQYMPRPYRRQNKCLLFPIPILFSIPKS